MKLLFFRKPAISISVSCTNRDPLKRSTAGINTRGGKECCESLPVWRVRGVVGGGGHGQLTQRNNRVQSMEQEEMDLSQRCQKVCQLG